MLSENERSRYSRHLVLPGFGSGAQEKLKAARVLVIGAGGLGCPVLQYLAAAGIGTIGIIDPDKVSLSNLQRQVLFGVGDIEAAKAEVAARKLRDLNPEISVDVYAHRLTASNAIGLFRQYELVIDCTDNFPTRYLVNDAAVLCGRPYVYGSVFRFEGQVAVFNQDLGVDGRGPNYRDLYPSPPSPGEVPGCEVGGVLGVLTGIIGSFQALQAIQLLTSPAAVIPGDLHLFDSSTLRLKTIHFERTESNPLTGKHPTITTLQDYESFCGVKELDELPTINSADFQKMRLSCESYQLIDVREPHEYALHHVGGLNLPLSSITENLSLIRTDIPVIVHCQSGRRARQAITLLEREFGFTNLKLADFGIEEFNV